MTSNINEDTEIKEEEFIPFTEVKIESEYVTEQIKEEPDEFDYSESVQPLIELEQKNVKNENDLLPFAFLPVKAELENVEENVAQDASSNKNEEEKKAHQKSNLTAVTLSPDGKYSCKYCQKTFRKNAKLERHVRVHTGIRPYSCEVCKKSFSQKTTLNIHNLIHTGDRPFPCDECEKTFRHKSSLDKHKLIHSGYRPFTCDVCGKSFTQKGNLDSHMRVHTGARPYSCHICKVLFAHKSHLNTHVRKHARDISKKEEVEERVSFLTE